MKTIDTEVKNKFEVDKSIFITYLAPAKSLEEAKAYLENKKKETPTATHHICIYRIGRNAEITHATDDGEPSGTAGQPALEAFVHQEMTNFVCVIIRYFGGILLGASGLTRTYRRCTSEILLLAEKKEIVDYTQIKMVFAYSYLDFLTNQLKDTIILQKEFTHQVTFFVKVPKPEVMTFCQKMIDLTSSQITLQILEEKEDDEIIIEEDKAAKWYER